MNRIEKAIDALHGALALRPSNQAAQDLLKQALDVNMSTILDDSHPLVISSKLQDQNSDVVSRKRAANRVDVRDIAKRLKHGQESSEDEEGDIMDLE